MTIFATSAQELKPVVIQYDNVNYVCYSDADSCIDFCFKNGGSEVSFACTPECYVKFTDALFHAMNDTCQTMKFKFQ
jgi:hypothetical protein